MSVEESCLASTERQLIFHIKSETIFIFYIEQAEIY